MYVNSGEATNTNIIVFGLTRLLCEPNIYTGGNHANYYTNDVVEPDYMSVN